MNKYISYVELPNAVPVCLADVPQSRNDPSRSGSQATLREAPRNNICAQNDNHIHEKITLKLIHCRCGATAAGCGCQSERALVCHRALSMQQQTRKIQGK